MQMSAPDGPLQRLNDNAKQPFDGSDLKKTQADKDDVLREISSLQQSIDICDDASREAG